MRLSNKQVQANLRFIAFGCKQPEPEFDEEQEAIINKVKAGDVIKTDNEFLDLTIEQQKI